LSLELDQSLVDKFRNQMNDPVFKSIYRNVDNKNYWNVMCSAVDWLSVTSEGIPKVKLEPAVIGADHSDTLNLMQYIVSVDVLFESIKQLYRVIEGTDKHPLSDDNKVFKQSELSDDRYFKHIRAAFSTHPVNLKSVDGIESAGEERFFASWVASGKLFSDGTDYYVYLYSNDVEKDRAIHLGVSIREINTFAEERFNLLENLIDKVNSILESHHQYYKNRTIEGHNDPVEQLNILDVESSKRLGIYIGGYGSDIQYIRRMLIVDKNYFLEDEYVREYKEYLKELIPIIKLNLEKMHRDGWWLLSNTWNEYEMENTP